MKIELNQNYRKLVNNIDNVEELQKKANNIKDISKEYNKEAANLKKVTCCRNFKWTLILIVLVIGILFLKISYQSCWANLGTQIGYDLGFYLAPLCPYQIPNSITLFCETKYC